MKDMNLGDITKPLTNFIKRFHTIIFFLVVSAGLFVAIFILLSIINSSGNSAAAGKKIDGTFDQATIDRLNKGGSTESPSKPGQRQSPFVE